MRLVASHFKRSSGHLRLRSRPCRSTASGYRSHVTNAKYLNSTDNDALFGFKELRHPEGGACFLSIPIM
jgi:hypothetical protein